MAIVFWFSPFTVRLPPSQEFALWYRDSDTSALMAFPHVESVKRNLRGLLGTRLEELSGSTGTAEARPEELPGATGAAEAGPEELR